MKSAEFELAPTNVRRPQTGLMGEQIQDSSFQFQVNAGQAMSGPPPKSDGNSMIETHAHVPIPIEKWGESCKHLIFRGLEGIFLKNVCMRLMMSEIGEYRSKDLIFRRLGRFFRIFHLIFRRRDLIFRGLHKIPGYKRHLNAECEARNAEFKKGIREIIEEFESWQNRGSETEVKNCTGLRCERDFGEVGMLTESDKEYGRQS